MNSFKVLFFVTIVVAAALAKTDDDEWEEFKKAHGKSMKDAREEAFRKANFLKTNKMIKDHNARGASFKMGHNKFSDWTEEEKKALKGKFASVDVPSYEPFEMTERQALPASLDWRTDACMPAIKNQGQCGSCWAFSSVASLEFLLCKSGQKTSLSEQQLVDCTCGGCNGGDYYPAWQYLNSTNIGSVAGSGYSYTGVQGTCKKVTTGLVRPLSWARIQYNTTAIMSALKTYGVLAVSMDVQNSFMGYTSGIYQATDCSNSYYALNHAMNLVGYGKDTATGLDFWVVRNSWGTTWGESGYIRVRRGTNVCGVETDVGYVKTNLTVTL